MAGTISFDGLATGIKTQETVDKLIEVESRPKILKEAEKARLENQLAAWQQVNTKLLDLRTKAQDLWKSSTWNTLSVKSSNDQVLTATTTSAARPGTYAFEVVQLAANHQVLSDPLGSAQTVVGTGTLDISVGSKSAQINVTTANNTLSGRRPSLTTVPDTGSSCRRTRRARRTRSPSHRRASPLPCLRFRTPRMPP
jgi:flagellar hook-associated protein 2